ncbi:MAG TPA: glycosyltransferase family 2 protein, partial [Candidatus Bathyarchaeia archaeon]|nr:glycosyltransferase family 2 protein [Candidatus Bathyarchaeia archaeon]
QTGFRLYTRQLIEAIGFPEPRFEAESAVIVRAARHGFSIVGVPVRLVKADGRATSHFRPVIDSLRIAGAVTRARLESRA